MMVKAWRQKCLVCCGTAYESYAGFTFCEDDWDKFRQLMNSVDWKAEPDIIVAGMRSQRRWK